MAITTIYSLDPIASDAAANQFTSGDQLLPATMRLSNGGYVLAYNNFSATVGGIIVDFFDADNNVVRSQIEVFEGSTTANGTPAITELSNGNIVVVWDDDHTDSPGLKGRIMDQNGQFVGNELALVGGTQGDPEVVALANGGFVVVYAAQGNVFFRVFDNAGIDQTGFTQVNALNTPGNQSDPTITALENGDFAITFTDNSSGNLDLYTRIFDGLGDPVSANEVVIFDGTSNVSQAASAALPNGDYAVVWAAEGWGSEGSSTGITLQIFDETGASVIQRIHVNTPTAGLDELDPAITVLDSGFIVVTWTLQEDSIESNIRGRIYDQTGNPITVNGLAEDFPLTSSSSNEVKSTVAALLDGKFLTSWQDADTANDNDGGSISNTILQLSRGQVGDNAANVFYATDLPDIMVGGDNDDVFAYVENGISGKLSGGVINDKIFGGGGDDTIRVKINGAGVLVADFRDATIESIENVSYTEDHTASGFLNAVFSSDQISDTGLSSTVLISGVGSPGVTNSISVNKGNADIDLSGWSFVNWSDDEDSVNLIGSNSADILVGSSQKNYISGADGDDIITAGTSEDTIVADAGNDIIKINFDNSSSSPLSGVYDGGDDTDRVVLGGSSLNLITNIDLESADFRNIEEIEFNYSGDNIYVHTLDSSQFGVGKIPQNLNLIDNTGVILGNVIININAPGTFDISGWTFEDWSAEPFGETSFQIKSHHNGDDIITGSSLNDYISAAAGTNLIKGGGGNDYIVGGDDEDTVVYDGNRSDFTITPGDNTNGRFLTVVDNVAADGDEGADRLFEVDFVQFAGQKISFDDLLNAAPNFTNAATANVTENTSAVITVTASNVGNNAPVFSITGGADSALFAINATSGELSFVSAPDFEAPGDGGSDNTYEVQVKASGGNNGSDTNQTLNVTVTNVAGPVQNGTSAGETLTGTDEEDTIYGGGGGDTLNGGNGNDTLVGNGNILAQISDTLNGGAGDDTFYAEFTDIINGGTGRDVLYQVNDFSMNIDLGTTSIEYMRGGFNGDIINAGTQTAKVEIYSGAGNDVVTGSEFDDFLFVGVGDDIVKAGSGDDVVLGDLGADQLSGEAGNDSIHIDAEDTFFSGGTGFDALYIGGDTGLTVDMGATSFEWLRGSTVGGDTVDASSQTQAVNVYASGGNDNVNGSASADFLWGEAGDDTLVGNNGDDVLVGGTGADTLTGGAGLDVLYGNAGGGGDGAVDTFVMTANWGTDIIFDFEHGVDKIDFSGTGSSAQIIFVDVGLHVHIVQGSNLVSVANAAGQIDVFDFIL